MSSLPLSVSLNVSVCVCVYLSRFKLDISISIELIVDTTSVKLNIKRSSHHYIKHCAALFTPHDIIILPTLPFPPPHALYTQINRKTRLTFAGKHDLRNKFSLDYSICN